MPTTPVALPSLCVLHAFHPSLGRRGLWPSLASPPRDSGGAVSPQSVCWEGGKHPRVLELTSPRIPGQSWGTRSLLTGPDKGHKTT